jgi:hypothetical protein
MAGLTIVMTRTTIITRATVPAARTTIKTITGGAIFAARTISRIARFPGATIRCRS